MDTKSFGWILAVVIAVFGFSSFAYAISAFIVPQGGTGWTNITANTVLYGNGTGRLATTTSGTNGQVLSLKNGIPSWVSTSTSASGVTSVTGTWPIVSSGGNTPNITFTGLSTSSPWTAGQVATVNGNGNVSGTATTTIGGSGVITVTAGGSVLGAGPITVACATCSTTLGTVTSVTGGTGLNGGAITSSGTLSLKSYLGTSTADTANQISVFTSTNATPATFGGFANFTFNSSTNTFVVTNATTTNVSASQSLFVASKQVNPYQNATFSYGATSTAWTGTTTETQLVAPFNGTLQDVQCEVPTGTLNVQVKVNSTSVTPMFNASTTNGTVTFTGSNTFVRGDIIEFDFGTPATLPTLITCTPRATVTSF